jgi:hypothetical protein
MTDSSDLIVLAVIVGVVAVLAFLVVFERSRLRRRDARMKLDSTQSDEERAFNRIQIVRAGVDHLAQQGYEVASVRATLARASEAEQRGDPSGALQLADSAREQLVRIRESPLPGAAAALPAETPEAVSGRVERRGAPSTLPAEGPGSPTLPAGEAPSDSPARGRLPPLQVQARFELVALSRDLAGLPAGTEDALRGEVLAFFAQGQAAYDRQEYPEAWRLALRGRRRLGRTIESVAASPAAVPPASPPPSPPPSDPVPSAGAVRNCPHCGQPLRENDHFCRACGHSLSASKCPRCGTALEPNDRFCATCGAPLAG